LKREDLQTEQHISQVLISLVHKRFQLDDGCIL